MEQRGPILVFVDVKQYMSYISRRAQKKLSRDGADEN